MPRRLLIIATGEIYHCYNRSIAKENIFSSKVNLRKALEIVEYYRFPQRIRLSQYKILSIEAKENYLSSMANSLPYVEIYAFSFMPNHFHFLLRQIQDGGISKFISNSQNSFAKWFNLKNDREGSLFQNIFKAKRVESNEEFIHIARYIHLNHVTSYLIEFNKLFNFPWCSFQEYINKTRSLININPILELFGSKDKFIKFHADQVDYQRKLKEIEKLIFE